MRKTSDSRERYGIVLAGGNGERIKTFVHELSGNSLPKQYVNFIGNRSLLEHTYDRAEKLIPRERLFTVVSREHLNYPDVRRQLSSRCEGTVIIQPENKDTGPGILLPLMHLYKRHPDSTVAVFPSDQFIREEDLFMAHVDLAFLVAEGDASSVVLLGIEPDRLEPEYGYILPDGQSQDLAPQGIRKVQLFVEKPNAGLIRELIAAGGLWNTMIMVFRAKILLDLVSRVAPGLYSSFEEIEKAIGTPDERAVLKQAYRRMEPISFSRGVLEALPLIYPSCTSVLPVSGVIWSDWGSEHRIVSTLKKAGYLNRLQGVSEGRLFKLWSGARC